jgi:anti-sigma factor RsiW
VECKEARTWLDGYVDGELDLARTIEIDEHLEACAACSQNRDSKRLFRDSIQASGLAWRCPDRVRTNIESLICREVGRPRGRPSIPRWWLSIAASLLLAVISWFAWRPMSGGLIKDPIAQQVVASHVRSLMADHLTDVASSDRHTVKPWFAGKLDFAPTVVDLSSEEFPLVGGRLDYLDRQPVAALVYQRRNHVINLFMWPSNQAADDRLQFVTYQGFQVVHWNQAGATYWATSDLNASELRQFAQLIQQQ